MEKKAKRSGMDPVEALTLIFVVLKLTGVVPWSWLWVLSPLWITVLFCALLLAVFVIGARIEERIG